MSEQESTIRPTMTITDLALVDGRWFDGMAFGEFTDMWGREVELKEADAEAYVANTKRNIAATTDADGNLVGLPIDAQGHDNGDGAGWIVDVRLERREVPVFVVKDGELEQTGTEERAVLEFKPRWTDLGRDLITKGIRRFFSPTVNLAKKVILGGSLTNWPASRDDDGKILLRPVALSHDETRRPPHNDEAGGISMSDEERDEGVQTQPDPQRMTLHQLSEDDRAALLEEARTQVAAENVEDEGSDEGAETPPSATDLNVEAMLQGLDLSSLGLEEAGDLIIDQVQKQLAAQMERIRRNQGVMLARMLREEREKNAVAQFSDDMTQGTKDFPFALPVEQKKLEQVLLSLKPKQREAVMELLRDVQQNGRIDLGERGHGERTKGTKQLPADIVQAVKAGELTRADLTGPVLEPVLGDIDQYDLSVLGKEE